MKIDIYDTKKNKLSETLEVSDNLIVAEPNIGLIHQLLLLQHTRPTRNAQAKTRSEVRGGGRKPWKQKGTGRARAGSLRSPLFVGGGRSHGPRFHEISMDMPVRMRRKALAHAISLQLPQIMVVDQYTNFTTPKTAETKDFCQAFNAESKKMLVIADLHDENNSNFILSLRNREKVKVLHWQYLNVHDLMNAEIIVINKVDFKRIEAWLLTAQNRKAMKEGVAA